MTSFYRGERTTAAHLNDPAVYMGQNVLFGNVQWNEKDVFKKNLNMICIIKN